MISRAKSKKKHSVGGGNFSTLIVKVVVAGEKDNFSACLYIGVIMDDVDFLK